MAERHPKLLTLLGSSREDLRAFPPDARWDVGHALWLVQIGLHPPDCKPMHTVGPGVFEIRVHSQLEHRVHVRGEVRGGRLSLTRLRKAVANYEPARHRTRAAAARG